MPTFFLLTGELTFQALFLIRTTFMQEDLGEGCGVTDVQNCVHLYLSIFQTVSDLIQFLICRTPVVIRATKSFIVHIYFSLREFYALSSM